MLMSEKWRPRRPQGLQWCLQVVPRAPKIDQKSIKFHLGGHLGTTCAKKGPQIGKQKRRKASKTHLFNEKRLKLKLDGPVLCDMIRRRNSKSIYIYIYIYILELRPREARPENYSIYIYIYIKCITINN